VPGVSPLGYSIPGYTGGGSGPGPGSASYLTSPGALGYLPPQQPSSSYSPRSPAGHALGVKVERSPDSQGASSAGSSSSGRPPTGAAESPAPGSDYHRRPPPPPGYYYPDDVHEMFGMYLPGGAQVGLNSPVEHHHTSQQWMNPGRFASHQYMTSPGHVGSDVTDDAAARINGAFTRLV